jgi:phosphomannomutase
MGGIFTVAQGNTIGRDCPSMKAKNNFRSKKLVVFDIDGTLTPSKAVADREMISLLLRLLERRMVAVIGGGKYALFKEQLIDRMPRRDARLDRLFLFPTSSTAFYRFSRGGWRCVYEHVLSRADKKKIEDAFERVLEDVGYIHPQKIYGVVLEDRRTQISFSPLGQKAPIPLKEAWKRKHNKLRARLARLLQGRLPGFKVRVGGLTTIDVTKKGIDKAYGIRQIEKQLHVFRKDMLFVGDAIFPGGNDYAIVRTGVDYVKVGGPEETKKIIKKIIED